ncbi:MAG: 30S ribosomal protein S8 [Candidatus Taylorbacteria bacterium]|nr:30S ribosomal protein S8 [Candidatus Taylorbacteria bacterium]
MVDVIAELTNNLKVSNLAGKDMVTLPYSKYRESILEALKRAGFIKSFELKGKKVIKTIEVELAYEDGKSAIQGVELISKYSRRMYSPKDAIKSVRSGYGALIVTTSKGVMTGSEARKSNVGGEVLFKIW